MSRAGGPRSDDAWWDDLSDEEREAVQASANTGSADDYSHLDAEDDDDA